MEKIVALCKNRGFIFAGSEIYGGLANTWDYGPLGVELKNNVKKAWWKKFVQENPYNVGLDAAILMNPQTWLPPVISAAFPIRLWTAANVTSVSVLTSLLRTGAAAPALSSPSPLTPFPRLR